MALLNFGPERKGKHKITLVTGLGLAKIAFMRSPASLTLLRLFVFHLNYEEEIRLSTLSQANCSYSYPSWTTEASKTKDYSLKIFNILKMLKFSV